MMNALRYGDGRFDSMIRIGVLALQGAFQEHLQEVEQLGATATEIRLPSDLHGCDGLILPGGETTTQRKLAQEYGLWDPIRTLGRQGFPILATCAGLILLAKGVDEKEGSGPDEHSLDVLDIDVLRNAYGRQVHSFEAMLEVPCLSPGPTGESGPFPAIFIRAPRICRTGPSVTVLSSWQGEPVAVEQGYIIGLSFHPELTQDRRFHRYFLDAVKQSKSSAPPSHGTTWV